MKTFIRALALSLLLTTGATAQTPIQQMTDAKLDEAFKVCVNALNDSGGSLVNNPEMSKLCTPVILEHDKRSVQAIASRKKQQLDDLKKLLK